MNPTMTPNKTNHWHFIVLIAVAVLTCCTSPLTPPNGFVDVPNIAIEVTPDSRASVSDVRVLHSRDQVLILGLVHADTMLGFRGGRVEALLLASGGGVEAKGFGNILSSQLGPHGSAPFRVTVANRAPFATCQLVVHPDVEGR